VRRAAGVEPHLSPPVSLKTLAPKQIEGHEFIYLKLLGVQGVDCWFNEDEEPVIDANLLSKVDLSGAVVFAAVCYLPESPMLKALMKAGASYVIGGSGLNYYWPGKLTGVDLLGLYVRWMLERGISPKMALKIGKARLKWARRDMVTRDTLAFKVWRGKI